MADIIITEYVVYDGTEIIKAFPESDFRQAIAYAKTIATVRGHKLNLIKRTSTLQPVSIIHPKG